VAETGGNAFEGNAAAWNWIADVVTGLLSGFSDRVGGLG
jgi:hypothetical protein